MPKRITADEFADRVSKFTNGRISIVKETYTGTHKRVTAYCNVHKIYFEVCVANFLCRKRGNTFCANCPECAKENYRESIKYNIKPWSEVLKSFINAYGNMFSYDESSYINTKHKIKIHCNNCGEDFELSPYHHLQYNNGGCPKCHYKKILKCSECGKPIIVDRHVGSNKELLCDECKQKSIDNQLIKCELCGQFHKKSEKCRNELCNILKSPNALKVLFALGFDQSTIGTEDYIKEFKRTSEILIEEYFINKLSSWQIFEKYNCSKYVKTEYNIRFFITKKLGLKLRSLSEAVRNSFETRNRSTPPGVQYKSEKHITWENKEITLRSSYEIDYANILDESKIPYDYENVRIRYFDTQQNKERVAVADFYLPKDNTIVEIKSVWTLDLVNMLDKVKAYKENGYNFKLILEHKEVDINSLNKEQLNFIDIEMISPNHHKTKIGHKKWKWMNDGNEIYKVPVDEIQEYLERGFVLGILSHNKNK